MTEKSLRAYGVSDYLEPSDIPGAEATLAEARNPDGTRRFYPPFAHPATARLVEHIERLKALPESEEQLQALGYSLLELARFERGEDRDKRDYLTMQRPA